MNKERLKEQLKELIIEKYDEIKYLRHRLNNLEIKQLNKFMCNGYWEFPDDASLPIGLTNCLVYWYEDSCIYDEEVYVNCMKLDARLTEFRDGTYMKYDMQAQVHFQNHPDTIELIMKKAKRLTKEEFIEKAKEHFNIMMDGLEKSLMDWK